MGKNQRAIYTADTWHIDDGTATDGSDRPPQRNPVRRVFTAEYKLAILAEYDACSESGEKGAILRREGLYSSLITDWRRQHRQGLLKAALGRSDGGRGGPSLSRGGQAASRERTAPQQAGPGRGDHRESREKCTRSWRRSRRARPPTSSRTPSSTPASTSSSTAASHRKTRLRGPRPLPAPRTTATAGHRCTARPTPRPRSPRALHRRRGRPRSSRSSTPSGSATRPPPRSGPRCSTKAPTWRRSRPCTGCCEPGPGPRTTAPGPPARASVKPELVATAPNQVWSWDITKLGRPLQVELVPPLRDPRRLQPLRRRLARRPPRVGPPRRRAHRRRRLRPRRRPPASSPCTPTAAAR